MRNKIELNELMDLQLCDKCNKKAKGVFYVRFIGGKKIFFCQECNEKEGLEWEYQKKKQQK